MKSAEGEDLVLFLFCFGPGDGVLMLTLCAPSGRSFLSAAALGTNSFGVLLLSKASRN